eukprot:CAMPEP_0118677098 /NCGR_PEP_ID=MMETSP0800-20121206/2428_1 /TAXON_ID=210618 ORGANISM="Striatella unipunctata, Strain CCMP2910" /NCGR_SAMPLE_ID=MMETSP0800 /ASSEMBLY_ACC=CAM_ASM_000638 /LENGTH=251 /DNA_ID=CAMNT_0006572713 /DNA_START=210 /DNA_END=965 /DNA_ORIENTATION=-
MPDYGVEERLPMFMGVLSYHSPQSLNSSLYNWREYLFPNMVWLDGMFVQLNERSKQDDEVMDEHIPHIPADVTVTGDPEEDTHPGLTIANFCRAAEKQTGRSENLLLYMEKDFQVDQAFVEELRESMESVHVLSQRGVNYIRLTSPVGDGRSLMWSCSALNTTWHCTPSGRHRWSNLPSVIRCDWFLRHLEPFALVTDTSYNNCDRRHPDSSYINWEHVLRDGRVEWVNNQWVVAHSKQDLFRHVEVDNRL